MKLILGLLFGIILSTTANALVCENDYSILEIKILNNASPKLVLWNLKLKNDDTFFYEGSGEWQKEEASEDAFSSFNEDTAISYQNKRAVFVLPDSQAIYFSSCN